MSGAAIDGEPGARVIETNPRRLGPINAREQLRIYLYLAPAVIVAFAALAGFYGWRLATFPRTTATIERLWEVERTTRRGTWIATFAELSFTRTTPDGRRIDCRHEFEIGRPRDGYRVGDTLTIIPAKGTCQRVDIIGRPENSP